MNDLSKEADKDHVDTRSSKDVAISNGDMA